MKKKSVRVGQGNTQSFKNLKLNEKCTMAKIYNWIVITGNQLLQ